MGKNYKGIYTDVVDNTAEMARLIPGAMQAFGALGKATYVDSALSASFKELIALAIGITVRCDGCVAYHARAAWEQGATREEVAEAISVGIHMGGGPSMVYGGEALAAFDQFNAEKADAAPGRETTRAPRARPVPAG